jgi:hypothetical protein
MPSPRNASVLRKSWIDKQAEWLAGLVAAVGLGAGFSGLGSHEGHHASGKSGDSSTGNGDKPVQRYARQRSERHPVRSGQR